MNRQFWEAMRKLEVQMIKGSTNLKDDTGKHVEPVNKDNIKRIYHF